MWRSVSLRGFLLHIRSKSAQGASQTFSLASRQLFPVICNSAVAQWSTARLAFVPLYSNPLIISSFNFYALFKSCSQSSAIRLPLTNLDNPILVFLYILFPICINAEKTKYVLLSRHQNAGQTRDMKKSKQIVWKCVTVQICGDDSNKWKFDSGGN
jgi:hypothetical protein